MALLDTSFVEGEGSGIIMALEFVGGLNRDEDTSLMRCSMKNLKNIIWKLNGILRQLTSNNNQ